jgi:hypothetical protein
MKRTVLPLLLGMTMLVACGPSSRGDDDDFGGNDGGNGGSGGSGGSADDGCSDASKLVYVVDENKQLSQFDPVAKTFHDLGTLNCQAGNLNPFSMGVDRNANAYVLYADQSGQGATSKVFKVDTNTAGLPCTATSFTAPSTLEEFGMGFSTTTAGGDQDQLFIAGGNNVSTTQPSELNTLDVTSMAVSPIGMVQGSPELTGNANAELWGFFPDATNPRIEKINKTTAAADSTFPLTDAASFQGQPLAWAWAFYGGDYWIFLEKDPASDVLMINPETSTTVYQISDTGVLKGKTAAPGRVIVGAGVSTCAPVVIE